MPLRRRFSALLFGICLLAEILGSCLGARAQTAPRKALTVERIYSQPSLSGRLTRGLAWSPDGKQVGFFETKGTGKEAKTELWVMDAATGERRVLVASGKLESVLPAELERATQATGLGRRPPSQYQWAPDGRALLFQGPTALVWFDLKSQTARTLVWAKPRLPTPRFLPMGSL